MRPDQSSTARPPVPAGSLLSIGSSGSILSIGSSGSILSIGSSGSVLSIGSAGSFGSAFSVGSVLSVASIFAGLSLWSLLSWRAVGAIRSRPSSAAAGSHLATIIRLPKAGQPSNGAGRRHRSRE